MLRAFVHNFLGHAPTWYKGVVIGCLLANPLVLWTAGPVVTGWLMLAQFMLILAMTLKCHPLQPGGLLALEAMILNLTDSISVYNEVSAALPVLLLLVFMVAGIYFLKELLLFAFGALLLRVRSQMALAALFFTTAALLSAFLDALAVMAMIAIVGLVFYQVYHRTASGKQHHDVHHDVDLDTHVGEAHRSDLDAFRAFLRGLLMHAAVGAVLGGAATQVGEPQSLAIAEQAEWSFGHFVARVAPLSLPALVMGFAVCLLVEGTRWFGYGTPLPHSVRRILENFHVAEFARYTARERAMLWVQTSVVVLLVVALAFHVAAVGLIGLAVLVLTTAFIGITDERRLSKAFEIALPFAALLVTFFVFVAAIRDQHLFEPIMQYALALEGRARLVMLYLVSGVLSVISDNVFVATVYIREVKSLLLQGLITREQFEQMAVAIHAGNNILSVATPQGHLALLFLLTSALAALVRLSFVRMLWMALPYAILLSATGLLAVVYWV